jgi:hypothetical protein
MDSVQSFIRAEVGRGACPVPKGAEAFSAYAIASAKQLIPEMEDAARLTLDHPMTFEALGEGLRLFEGSALRDLINFRKRCGDNLVTCLDSFLEVNPPGPSSIWAGCPEANRTYSHTSYNGVSYTYYYESPDGGLYGFSSQQQTCGLPRWINQLLLQNQDNLKIQKFTRPLDIYSRIRQEYFTALQDHATCNFCSGVHIRNGSTFCAELENKIAQACNKVPHSLYFQLPYRERKFTSFRYAVIMTQILI